LIQTVFVFPGQGSQSVGMMAELAGRDRVITDTFAEASDVLGYDLWRLVQDGPADKLAETLHTQPAMLAADVATFRYWHNAGGPMPHAVAGHSLGEYAALVAAQVLDFPTAVRIVRERAQRMQEAVPVGQGAIAAILGLEDEQATEVCRAVAQDEVVEAVNFNAPGQVVIAGHAAAVERAIEACKAAGAKRAVMLPMSVPAHSSLMRVAAQGLAATLRNAPFADPQLEFWSPVDASHHATAEEIRDLMISQLASPVRWAPLVQQLIAAGYQAFVECGPGEVLVGLNRRVGRRVETLQHIALRDPASVETALKALSN
jgi:[acyl-carrier-protein] S-malonyltransferase